MNVDEALLVADGLASPSLIAGGGTKRALELLAAEVRRQHAEIAALSARLKAADGMAECMDMLRDDLERMGVVPQGTAPMFMTEAICGEMARLRDHAVTLANTERIVERNRCAAIVQANADASGDWLHTILQSNADAILREPNADIGGIE